ncbi:hypothetical protein [Aurantimonas coralicida]|uniref:hypothetical protein n=1 Tax=Aurantimonas coralicida TaxID=182270 RepID=UPI001D19801C|nr:hypothetical protein [Aurantimonas coralicida]MCC4299332.1 hypothetical protein [Aurantimonas coralicida]
MSAPHLFEAGAAATVEDAGFLAFTQIHLRATERDSFAIGDGFATYAAFIRRRGSAPLSRASFGAMVAALAKRVGGGRADDVVSGLALQRPVAAPACEGLRDVPPTAPLPSAPQLTILRQAQDEDGAAETGAEPADAVDGFLAARLCERHGSVVSLETPRGAVRAHGLKFADVIERAKARGPCRAPQRLGAGFPHRRAAGGSEGEGGMSGLSQKLPDFECAQVLIKIAHPVLESCQVTDELVEHHTSEKLSCVLDGDRRMSEQVVRILRFFTAHIVLILDNFNIDQRITHKICGSLVDADDSVQFMAGQEQSCRAQLPQNTTRSSEARVSARRVVYARLNVLAVSRDALSNISRAFDRGSQFERLQNRSFAPPFFVGSAACFFEALTRRQKQNGGSTSDHSKHARPFPRACRSGLLKFTDTEATQPLDTGDGQNGDCGSHRYNGADGSRSIVEFRPAPVCHPLSKRVRQTRSFSASRTIA